MSDMGEMMTGMGPWMMVIWGLLSLIILGLAVAGGVWLIRELLDRRQPAVGPQGPREILQHRYAAGEIDEDEYLQRLAGLD